MLYMSIWITTLSRTWFIENRCIDQWFYAKGIWCGPGRKRREPCFKLILVRNILKLINCDRVLCGLWDDLEGCLSPSLDFAPKSLLSQPALRLPLSIIHCLSRLLFCFKSIPDKVHISRQKDQQSQQKAFLSHNVILLGWARTGPSINYANDWLGHLFLFSDLVWSGKRVSPWIRSLGGSQQPF